MDFNVCQILSKYFTSALWFENNHVCTSVNLKGAAHVGYSQSKRFPSLRPVLVVANFRSPFFPGTISMGRRPMSRLNSPQIRDRDRAGHYDPRALPIKQDLDTKNVSFYASRCIATPAGAVKNSVFRPPHSCHVSSRMIRRNPFVRLHQICSAWYRK